MSTITLHDVVLTQIGQPLLPVRAKSSDRTPSMAVAGSVQKYASGRFRSVTQAGIGRQIVLTLRDVPTGDVVIPAPTSQTVRYVDLLQEWMGTTVLYRDSYGNFLYCVYFAVAIKEMKNAPYVNVGITLQELTGVVGQ